jgi:hypothetical protein
MSNSMGDDYGTKFRKTNSGNDKTVSQDGGGGDFLDIISRLGNTRGSNLRNGQNQTISADSDSIRMKELKEKLKYDTITILIKQAKGDVPLTIETKLLLLGNDLVVSALNNDIQYLNLPFPPQPPPQPASESPIKSYTIPRSLQRTAQFNISADVEDMNKNCGIYEEFKEQSLKIIKASIPDDCYKGSKDPKCMTILNDTFLNKIATDPKNELCFDFWRLCIAYRIHFRYILNSKFTHEVADQLLKRRITSLLVALAHYSSGQTLDIERIGSSNTYRADYPA